MTITFIFGRNVQPSELQETWLEEEEIEVATFRK